MSLGETLLVLAVYVLAVARVTRLINYDYITDPFRQWVLDRVSDAEERVAEAGLAEQPTMAKMLSRRHSRWAAAYTLAICAWCAGMWIALAGAGVAAYLLHWHWLTFLPLGLACSYLVGIGDRLAADPDIEVVKQ